jgi:hypothetical protein
VPTNTDIHISDIFFIKEKSTVITGYFKSKSGVEIVVIVVLLVSSRVSDK